MQLSADGIYFVRFGGNEMTLPFELASLGEMLEDADEGYKLWRCVDRTDEREMDRAAGRAVEAETGFAYDA